MYASQGLAFFTKHDILQDCIKRGVRSSRNVNLLPSAFLGQQSASQCHV